MPNSYGPGDIPVRDLIVIRYMQRRNSMRLLLDVKNMTSSRVIDTYEPCAGGNRPVTVVDLSTAVYAIPTQERYDGTKS